MPYIIDIPDWDFKTGAPQSMIAIDSFDTHEEALKFVQDNFQADSKGRINLISDISSDASDDASDDADDYDDRAYLDDNV